MLQFGSILESAWLDLGRGWGSKWSQKMAPKSLPKSIPKSIKKMITFWIVSRSIPEPCGLLPSTLVYLLRAICNSELCRFVLQILVLSTIPRTALSAVNGRTALRAVPTNEKSPTTVLHLMRLRVSHVGLGDLGLGFVISRLGFEDWGLGFAFLALGFEVLRLGFEDWGLGFAILCQILEAQPPRLALVWGSRFGAETSKPKLVRVWGSRFCTKNEDPRHDWGSTHPQKKCGGT